MTLSLISLRPYQADAIEAVANSLRRHQKTVLSIPTGGGKTRIATAIIQRALNKGNAVLFICDREELIDQTSRAFDKAGIDHGVIQGMHWRRRPGLPVQIATAQTLARRRWPHADLVIWDEAHTVYKNVLKKMREWDGTKFLGLTATPLTKGMGKDWEDLVVGTTAKELIAQGFLCRYEVYGPPPADLSGVKTVAGDYHQGQLSDAVSKKQIIGDVVTTWLSLGENRQTICFAVDVAHSQSIVETFQAYGVKAAHIDAYTDSDERRQTLKDFADGKIKIVSSVDILTKGYDQPQASCLIMARPTKSRIVFIQQAGRVLRTAEGKDKAIILDHGGNTERHGFPCDDLPKKLCDGSKGESASQKAEREPPKPKACQKCHHVKPAGVHECPKCGFAPQKQTGVEATDHKLVKVERIDSAEKRRWYSMLLWHALEKGYSPGWAAHKFKDKFGQWPYRKDVDPVEPDEEVRGYLKYLNIRQAKSKRRDQSCRYCNSTNLTRQPGVGPHHAQLRCNDCGRHVQWLSKGAA